MIRLLSSLCALMLLGAMSAIDAGEPAEKPLTIVLVGDSTVSNYPESGEQRGWGQMIGSHFVPGTKVVNLALAGASTKTFLANPRWPEALKSGADFIFIQFGHNDSHRSDLPESTRADGDYTTNLQRFIDEARRAGAVPILVTPMHRRTFDSQGKLTAELLPYAEAMKKVAAAANVPIIDLYTSSGELFETLGDAGSSSLTLSASDRTHFSRAGAEQIAKLVAQGAEKIDDAKLRSILSPSQEDMARVK